MDEVKELAIQRRSALFAKDINTFVISTEEDVIDIGDLLVVGATLKKDNKAEYEEVLGPLRTAKRVMERKLREAQAPVIAGIEHLKGLLRDYEQEKKQGRLDAAAKLDTMSDASPMEKLEVLNRTAEAVQHTKGVYTRTGWGVEVVDISLVPAKYMIADIQAIKAAVKASEGEPIPGVHIEKTETIVARSK